MAGVNVFKILSLASGFISEANQTSDFNVALFLSESLRLHCFQIQFNSKSTEFSSHNKKTEILLKTD